MPPNLPYIKPYKYGLDLINILKSRSFHTTYSDSDFIEILNSISYFALNRYRWYSDFYDKETKKYIIPTNDPNFDHLEILLTRYYDDILLKTSSMKLINIIEDTLKNKLIEFYGNIQPLSYTQYSFTEDCQICCCTLQKKIKGLIRKNDGTTINSGIDHFYRKYSGTLYDSISSQHPPIWKLVNCLSFSDLIKMLTIQNNTTKDTALHSFLTTTYGCASKNILTNRFNAIRWIRNVCAHFEHIIGRGSMFYANPSRDDRSQKNNIGSSKATGFAKDRFYYTTRQGTTCPSVRNFVWYYEVVYLLLKATAKIPIQKTQANSYLAEIKAIVLKPEYSHLGFDQNKAKFQL